MFELTTVVSNNQASKTEALDKQDFAFHDRSQPTKKASGNLRYQILGMFFAVAIIFGLIGFSVYKTTQIKTLEEETTQLITWPWQWSFWPWNSASTAPAASSSKILLNDGGDVADSLNRLNQHQIGALLLTFEDEESVSITEGPSGISLDDVTAHLVDDKFQILWIVMPDATGKDYLYLVFIGDEDPDAAFDSLALPEDLVEGLQGFFNGENHNVLFVESKDEVTRENILENSQLTTTENWVWPWQWSFLPWNKAAAASTDSSSSTSSSSQPAASSQPASSSSSQPAASSSSSSSSQPAASSSASSTKPAATTTSKFVLNDGGAVADSLNRLNQRELGALLLTFEDDESVTITEAPPGISLDDVTAHLEDDKFQILWVVTADPSGDDYLYLVFIGDEDPDTAFDSLELPEDLVEGLQSFFNGQNHNVLFVESKDDVTQANLWQNSQLATTQYWSWPWQWSWSSANIQAAVSSAVTATENAAKAAGTAVATQASNAKAAVTGKLVLNDGGDVADSLIRLNQHELGALLLTFEDDESVTITEAPPGISLDDVTAHLEDDKFQILWVVTPDAEGKDYLYLVFIGDEDPDTAFDSLELPEDLVDGLQSFFNGENHNVLFVESKDEVTQENLWQNSQLATTQYWVWPWQWSFLPWNKAAASSTDSSSSTSSSTSQPAASSSAPASSTSSQPAASSSSSSQPAASSSASSSKPAATTTSKLVLTDTGNVVESLQKLDHHEIDGLIIRFEDEDTITLIEGPNGISLDDLTDNLVDDKYQIVWVVMPDTEGVNNLYLIFLGDENPDVAFDSLGLPEELIEGIQGLFNGENHNVLFAESKDEVTRQNILTNSQLTNTQLLTTEMLSWPWQWTWSWPWAGSSASAPAPAPAASSK